MGSTESIRGLNPLKVGGMSRRGALGRGKFNSVPLRDTNFLISGVTRDLTGVPLGNCVVKLFESSTDLEVDQTTSDGVGNFSFNRGSNGVAHYIVAYKAGSPDVVGTTVNTLLAI